MKRLGELLFAEDAQAFRGLLCGDVTKGGDHAALPAHTNQPGGDYAGQQLTVLGAELGDDIVQLTLRHQLFAQLLADFEIEPEIDFQGVFADDLLWLPTKCLGKAWVDLDKSGIV